jgi:hypothetical protein
MFTKHIATTGTRELEIKYRFARTEYAKSMIELFMYRVDDSYKQQIKKK